MRIGFVLVALVPSLLLRAAAPGLASPGTGGCVGALNRAGVEVARAQAAFTAACLAAGAGDVAACIANDANPGLSAARRATFAAAVAECEDPPALGVAPTGDDGVNAAAVAHVRGLVADALGSSPGGALVDHAANRRGRRCQVSVVKAAGGVATAFLHAFERCVRLALARGVPGEAELTTFVAAAAKGPVAAARRRLVTVARKGCRGSDVPAAFPGVCSTGGTTAGLGRCLGARAACRACRAANAMDALAADCDLIDDGTRNDSCAFRVRLSGDAIPFVGGPTGRIEGANVSLLELPDRHVVTGADGHFVFDGLEEGSDVTVVMSHADYHPIQTGTFRLGPGGVERVTFQAVTPFVYDALAALLAVTPDDTRCQMVTTVTRVGKSIYDAGAHGEDGVTVTLSPPLPADQGPIYFNSSVLPDRSLMQTSDDGGVLFIQVPPGEYVWTAHKAGAVFSRIRMKCRAGFLVNASPPQGLQRH